MFDGAASWGLAPLVPIAPLPPPLPSAEKAVAYAPLLPATPLPPARRAGPPPPPEPPKDVPAPNLVLFGKSWIGRSSSIHFSPLMALSCAFYLCGFWMHLKWNKLEIQMLIEVFCHVEIKRIRLPFLAFGICTDLHGNILTDVIAVLTFQSRLWGQGQSRPSQWATWFAWRLDWISRWKAWIQIPRVLSLDVDF